ncbi:hypothetical protein [Phosphitispora sp. TUW77]|uniref:hypothetical protein n=1 Tax=Phosphitispora sp. TUW77 TaxID=3152361 RepID=UPI003AB4E778
MKQETLNEKLEKEKGKLNRLADEALKNGIPLTQDKAFMTQNRKIDELVARIQIEQEKHKKNIKKTNMNDKS